MSVITTRSGKGSALTSAEVDANFTNLNSDKAEKSITISAGTGLTGGGDLSGNRSLGLATSGVSAGTFGGNNSIPTLTIDAYGRVTAAGTVTPSGTWGISIGGNAATATNQSGGSVNATTGAFSDVVSVSSYVNRVTGNGNSAWLQQDGTGRVHWYWNTYGGVSPVFTNAGEDASAISMHVTGNGSGGAFFHRSASGVGKAAGDAITWTTTLYSDLNTLSWKGNTVLRSDNYNSYAPTLTGTGASGTWGISISGNAATVTDGVYLSGTQTISGNKTFSGVVGFSNTITGSITGNAGTATTATNQSGGSVNATTGDFSGLIRAVGGTLQVGSSAGVYRQFRFDGTMSSDGTNFHTILNAANYNGYAPTLTGGGASGTWGINVTGNAATVTNGVYTTGNQTINGVKTFTSTLSASIDGNSATVGGFGIANIPSGNNGTAASDGVADMNLLTQKSGYYFRDNPSNAPEATWNTWMTAMGHYAGDRYGWQISQAYWSDALWTRRLTSNTWQAWRKILDSGNYNEYAPTKTGGGASGTWGISITGNAGGNAATATALQTARTINGVSFNGTANITIRGFQGTGNDYNNAGLELIGNGGANTVYPTLGFHQPGVFAATLRNFSSTQFGFYQQTGAYADLYVRNLHAANDSRAPTFYNINDTRYYQNFNDSHRLGSHNGYIDIGPKNNQTCHIYTDRPSFYFNQALLFNGKRVLNDDDWINNKYFSSDGSIRGTVFYDSNDATYYCDPNQNSRFFALTVGVGGAYADIYMKDDEANSGQTRIHANSNIIGFLRGDGGQWFLYAGPGGAYASAFNNTSDYRLKNVVGRFTGDALSIIGSLEEVEYTFIEGGKADIGYLAHQVQAVYPTVVTGEKDAVKKDGSIDPQTIDYGKMVPLLSAGIKQLMQEIKALKAEVAFLRG